MRRAAEGGQTATEYGLMLGLLLALSLAILVLIAPGLRDAFERGTSTKPAGFGANAIDTQPSNYDYE